MKSARFQRYLKAKAEKKANPAMQKEDTRKSPDKKTDQDFPGYPHGNAAEELIRPKTKTQKKVVSVGVKDGEKKTTTPAKKKTQVKKKGSGGS